MSIPETSWTTTRLAVKYHDAAGDHDITPIQSFSPTFATSAEPLHSIERTHVGVVATPQSMTFSMSVNAIGPVAAQLTALALKGTQFDIVLQEHNGSEWSFSTVVMSNCVITSAVPTSATVSGVPTATFSGFSMQVAATDSNGVKTVGPTQASP
jgi:hypothetical protein